MVDTVDAALQGEMYKVRIRTTQIPVDVAVKAIETLKVIVEAEERGVILGVVWVRDDETIEDIHADIRGAIRHVAPQSHVVTEWAKAHPEWTTIDE